MTGTTRGRVAPAEVTTAVEFALVTAIWGSTWLVIKGQLGVVPIEWSVTYRFVVAGLALAAVAAARREWRWPPLAGHGFALVVGITQFVLNYNLVYLAETRLASGLVALTFALLIVPNTILAAIFLKTPVTRRFAVGAAIGIAGLTLLFAHDLAGAAAGDGAALAMAIAAVFAASVSNVLQAGGLARSLPPLPTLALSMLYGAAIDGAVAWVSAGAPRWDPRSEYVAGLAYLALIASTLAFSVYYRLIRRMGPASAAYSSVVIPVLAMVLSTVFEDYRWTLATAAGAGLALAGLVVALGGRRVRDTPAAPPENP